MTFWDDHGGKVVGGIVASVFAGITWLVRTVFTNQKTLDLHASKLDQLHDDLREMKAENRQALTNQSRILDLIERQERRHADQ